MPDASPVNRAETEDPRLSSSEVPKGTGFGPLNPSSSSGAAVVDFVDLTLQEMHVQPITASGH